MSTTNTELAQRIEDNVPELLKSNPQWVMWKYRTIEGKIRKPLYKPNGEPARSNDPQSWSEYFSCLTALISDPNKYDGIGYVLTSGLVVIDLDHCISYIEDQRRITKHARQIYDLASSYSEISPSGTGLHIFLLGSIPADRIKKAKGEMYQSKQFITITGNTVTTQNIYSQSSNPIREDQQAINLILSLIEDKKEPPQAKEGREIRTPHVLRTLSDEKILEKALTAKNGDKFSRLYGGNISFYPSQSEAVIALYSMLLYWTNSNEAQAERLFYDSDLYKLNPDLQEKWESTHRTDGATYQQMTKEKARRGLKAY